MTSNGKEQLPALSYEANDLRWNIGRLKSKLYGVQRECYDAIDSSLACGNNSFYLNCTRRGGKSTVMLVKAIETCLSIPGAQVRYAAPTNSQLNDYVFPLLRAILKDCPKPLTPIHLVQRNVLEFPNGSIIKFSGCTDGHEESLRGSSCDLFLIDEARDIKQLTYLIQDIAQPQLLSSNNPNKAIIIGSTPPKDMGHPFISSCEKAKLQGNYFEYDIDRCTWYSPQEIEVILQEMGGRESPSAQREFFCKFIRDEKLHIIPEFDVIRHVKTISKDGVKFSFYDKYESLDLGGVDKTVCIFGYVAFGCSPSVVIERELVLNGKDSRVDSIGQGIKKIENVLQYKSIFRRTADVNDRIAVNSLNSTHGFNFTPVEKIYGITNSGDKGLRAMVNELRTFFDSDQIAIDPSCVELIGCLKTAMWTEKGKFDQSEEYGHFDALAALMYFIRSLDMSHNPFPKGFGVMHTKQFNEPQVLSELKNSGDFEGLDGLKQAFSHLGHMFKKKSLMEQEEDKSWQEKRF